MGFYINQNSKGVQLPARGKAKVLLEDGAILVAPEFQPNLVCVVSNGPFDAAGYCYNEREFNDWTDPNDRRLKIWLVYEHARLLSGYEDFKKKYPQA